MDKNVIKYFENNIKNEELFINDIEDSIEYNNEDLTIKGEGIYSSIEPNLNDYRYYLELFLPDQKDKNGKILTALMINPSKTFPKINQKSSCIDSTVKNVLKIALTAKIYSKVVVINSFPIINPSPKSYSILDENKKSINEHFVDEYLSKYCTDLLIAFGADKKYYKHYFKSLKKMSNNINKWAFNWNEKSDTPTHPSPRNSTKLKEFFNEKQGYKIEISNDKINKSDVIKWQDI